MTTSNRQVVTYSRTSGGFDGPPEASVCREHDDTLAGAYSQVSHGRHWGECVACEAAQGGYRSGALSDAFLAELEAQDAAQ